MDEYYIDLLIDRCIDLKKSKILFIRYFIYNESFIQKLLNKLEKYNLKEIYLDCIDPFYEHDLLKNMTLKEIEDSNYFDNSIYNEYAKKNANFLFFESPIPDLMNDIEFDKLALVSKIKSNSKKQFVKKEMSGKLPWSIVPLYNKYWEEALGLDNLQKTLYDICKVNKNVLENWNKFLKTTIIIKNKINNLKLEYLHFKNSLGTDLKVYLPKDYNFECSGDNYLQNNLPSFEIFTSPNKFLTEGKVYSSKPLYYNSSLINDLSLEFKDGKVVKADASKGKELLESIINFDDNSSYLGEVALVECDSPISKTGIVFKTTLLDENASCHLALGRGFGYGRKSTLEKRGINFSNIHVDFMIGTDDMNVTGYVKDKMVPIMKNGKFVI